MTQVWPERFKGRAAIVTGAASGIGAATARRLVREGAHVMLVDKEPSQPSLRDLPARQMKQLRCAVACSESADEIVDQTLQWQKRLDVLVNCAGYPVTEASEQMPEAVWRAHFEADVHGIHFLTDAARPHLERHGGAVVNVTSVAGLGGDRAMQAYNAAKGAAVRLTNAQAIDFGRRGVRVNAVCPTITHTEMSREVERRGDLMEKLRASIPLGRIGAADEVAAAIAFLASDEASFITGVALPVDGGITAGNGQPVLV